ncbi:MAG TPA: ACT domain-containing protein [Thermoanaerobaculia bacterium]|nr:ACT domain-containing protein [Thermoanaerobaculia bacterium]
MSGEKSLDRLIRSMNPVLRGGTYVYCTLPAGSEIPAAAIAAFREQEATTVILESADAEAHRLDPLYKAAWITLTVHSDLDAVGFLAAISAALALRGISCNVVSAVYHDHLFVPVADAERALEILRSLQLSPSPTENIQST